MIDLYTFGRAPAAMYLAQLLNDMGDKKMTRKVSRFICENHELINGAVFSHMQDTLSTQNFAKIIELIAEKIETQSAKFEDKHIGHLACNVLMGYIKTQKRRCMTAAKIQTEVNKVTPEGETPPEVSAIPSAISHYSEITHDKVEQLRERSRSYLARKGKINTLY